MRLPEDFKLVEFSVPLVYLQTQIDAGKILSWVEQGMSSLPCTNEAVTGIRVFNRPDSIRRLDGHTLRRVLDAVKFPFSTLSMKAGDFLVRYNERVTDVCFAVPTHPPAGHTPVYGLSFRISKGGAIRNAAPPATAATRAARARVAATLARAAATRAARAAATRAARAADLRA